MPGDAVDGVEHCWREIYIGDPAEEHVVQVMTTHYGNFENSRLGPAPDTRFTACDRERSGSQVIRQLRRVRCWRHQP